MPRRRAAPKAEVGGDWWEEFLKFKGLEPVLPILPLREEEEFEEFLKRAVKVEPSAPKSLAEFYSLPLSEQAYWLRTYEHYKRYKEVRASIEADRCRRCGGELRYVVERERGYCMDCYFEMAGVSFGPKVRGPS